MADNQVTVHYPPQNMTEMLYVLGVHGDHETAQELLNLGPTAMMNDLMKKYGYTYEEAHRESQKFSEACLDHYHKLNERRDKSSFWEMFDKWVELGFAERKDGKIENTTLTEVGDRMLILAAYFIGWYEEIVEMPPAIDPRELEVYIAPEAWDELINQGYSQEQLDEIYNDLVSKFRSGELLQHGQRVDPDDIPEEIIEGMNNIRKMH